VILLTLYIVLLFIGYLSLGDVPEKVDSFSRLTRIINIDIRYIVGYYVLIFNQPAAVALAA
jgi:hypothetical protein